MPTTSSGDTVYADPDDMVEYVQTDANQFSLSTTGSPSEWREFLEKIQVRMKARIDEYVDRQDFEHHQDDTRIIDVGASPTRILELPAPVITVDEVRVRDEALDGGGYGSGYGDVTGADQYEVRDSGQLIRTGDSDAWPSGYGNVKVTLDWGYASPPEDVVEAELKLVAHTVTGLAQLREGMVVQQDDIDLQIALPNAMTTEVKNILRHHRSGGRSMGVI